MEAIYDYTFYRVQFNIKRELSDSQPVHTYVSTCRDFRIFAAPIDVKQMGIFL